MGTLCASHITDVVVHARGALVTRRVTLPGELPDGELDLVVPDLSVVADPGSVRASLRESTRHIVAVATALHVPDERVVPGPTVANVRELVHRRDRLRAEHERLLERRDRLGNTLLDPRLATTVVRVRNLGDERDQIDARISDALATSAMVSELATSVDARLAALDEQLREVERALEAAALVDAQASSAARAGASHPTRRVTVRLAGAGGVGGLDLTYVVPAARWWPTYTLRLADGGAEWWLEAFVAQLSGEDWHGVNVAFSTADLVHDARLPELASLRLGRGQAAAKKAYRPPPAGLDTMFAGYDRAFAIAPPPAAQPALIMPTTRLDDLIADELAADDALTAPGAGAAYGGAPDNAMRTESGAFYARAPSPAMPMMAPAAAPMAKRAASASRGGGGPPQTQAAPRKPAAPAEPAPLEPGDAWLDFDSLALAGDEDRGHRGRLVLAPAGAAATRRAEAHRRIEALAPAGGVRDPQLSRGQFDHVYTAAGAADVPSDGITHRVTINVGKTTPSLRYRTVPREAAEVYKEAELRNPFTSPLLAGPVDVYVEGSLLVTTAIDWIDSGGPMAVGLGVEDRLRVARNARSAEDTAGLLGGSVIVDHTVTVDLTSSLAAAVRVEILDRLPTTDDKELKIELTGSRPEGKSYKQTDRGAPIRRGLSWLVDLPAGGKTRVEYEYRLTFSGKQEVVEATAVSEPARITAASRIERVTFFEDRAEVVRAARSSFPAGTSWLAIEAVSLYVDDASVSAGIQREHARVTGARVVRRLRQVATASAAEIDAIEADLRDARSRRVDAERALARATADDARALTLIDKWADNLARVPRGGAEEAARWRAAHDAIDTAVGRALDEVAVRRAALELAQLDEKRAQLRLEQGRALHPRYEASIEVQVHLREAAEDVAVEIKYRTPCAVWRPEHLARLDTEGRAPEMVIKTSAAVWQHTGEDWRDVTCRFSTARPAQAASPPLLRDDFLSLQRKQDRSIVVEARDVTVAVAGLDRGTRQVDEMPGVDDGGEPLSFEPARPVTIPSDGQVVRVDLGEVRLPCSVDTVVFPELGGVAHVRATATLTGGKPLLAGPVRLARNAAMVGRGKLAFVGQGEPFELGFGVDDGLRVRRRVDEKRDTGLTGSHKVARTVHLFVSNLGAGARKLLVVERVPVSEIGEVEIKVVALGGAKLDEKDGFARFDVDLAGGATRELELAYRIEAGARVQMDL